MLHRVSGTVTRFLLVLVVILVTLIGSQIIVSKAQNDVTNLRHLLESLNERILAEPGFEIAFKFHEPILEVGDNWWYVPSLGGSSDVARGILEIGEDYICFEESAGSSQLVRCTPFSNIAALNYANLP